MDTRTTLTRSVQGLNTDRSRVLNLPIKRNLTFAYILSSLVALLIVVVSAFALLHQAAVYPTKELLLSFVPSDTFTLAVGLPLLLGSMWLAQRGSLIGLLSWPSVLFYIVYMYIPYAIAAPWSPWTLAYLALIVFSAYTMISVIASIDRDAVRQRLEAFVPARTSGGILIGLASLIVIRQAALIITLTAGISVDAIELSAWIADFTVAVPSLLLGGIWLWRRDALGYAAGAGILFGYGLLALSLLPYFLWQASTNASPLDLGGIIVVLVMSGLCFVPLAFFARGAASNPISFENLNATRVIATTIGVFFGLFSGVNHGIFEVLQGNQPTNGLLINAIGEGQRFWIAGTEPAFTLIPNFMLTGIASIIVGLAIVIWSIWFLPGKQGRTVFLGLFLLSFLVGGGMGQAFFFLPAWAFATRMEKPLTWWRKMLSRNTWPFLSRLWMVLLVFATVTMLIGLEMAIFGYFPGITDSETLQNVNMTFVFGSAILYVLSFLTGFGHELLRMERDKRVVQ
jgi:hypothetical protein